MQRDRRPNKIFVLAKRELLSRIKSRGFWLATLVLPMFIGVLFVVPSLILSKTQAELKAVLVDETGDLAAAVAERLGQPAERGGRPSARIEVTVEEPAADREAQRAELDRRVLGQEIDAWIWIGRDGLAEDRFEYHAESVSNVITQDVLQDAVSAEVERQRLAEAGYDPDRVGELTRPLALDTVRVTATGSRAERGEAGFILAYVMFFVLYIVFILWGQQVLTGVLEEKSSRIVEVIVSTARPFDLMMGKLIGIGLAGLIQLGVWLACLVAVSAPGIAGMMAAADELPLPTLSAGVAVQFCIFFLLGFFIYSTLYAAVGSAFNNVQEAQQLAVLPMSFIIAPMLVVFPVINDPDSLLATVSSLIPFFTPILMPVRMAVKMPPLWQIGLSYLLTAGAVVFMVWLCARVYRVGILMYGKKPTLRELWRWLRYA